MTRKRGNFRSYHILNYGDSKLFIIVFVLMVALIIENSYSQVADFVTDQIVSFWGIVLFVITSSIYAFGGFVILEMIKAKNRESGQVSMWVTELIITIIQYILTSVIIIVILQVLFSTQYNKDLLTASYNISYLSSIFLTSVLAWRLFSWYKIQKKPIVLLYGLGAVFIILNLISSIVWTDAILLQKPSVVFQIPKLFSVLVMMQVLNQVARSISSFLVYTIFSSHTFSLYGEVLFCYSIVTLRE